MPIYEYHRTTEAHCPECEGGFEAMQKMADSPLEACPSCHAPAKRIISAVAVAVSSTNLSPGNLEKHGFTQYRKAGSGLYEKTAGKGPETLKK